MGRDHRSVKVTLLFALLAAGLAGCSDDGARSVGPTTTSTAGTPHASRVTLFCTATTRPASAVCRPLSKDAGSSASGQLRRQVIVGKQGVYVNLAVSNFVFKSDTFSFSATVQNLMTQPLGTQNGTTVSGTGVDVFFTAGPSSETGTGTVTPVGTSTGTFTASGQQYYEYAQIIKPDSTSAALTWKFYLTPQVTEFNFYVEVAGDMPAEGSVYRWTSLHQGVTGNQLNAVWQANASDLFAVGVNGTVLNYNGTTWSALALNQPTYQLRSVSGSSTTDVWMVGDNGVTVHYNGSAFTTVTPATTANFKSVYDLASNHVYAVGLSTVSILEEYNGTSWVNIAAPHGVVDTLYGVWAADSNHVFAVGSDGRLLEWSGSAWTQFAKPTGTPSFRSVWGTSATDVYAVATSGAIYHYNGTTWTAMTSPVTTELDAIGGTSDSNIWAVGVDGTTLNYNGTAWDTVARVAGLNLHGVTNSTSPWAVGDNGALLQYSGGAWTLSTQSGLSFKRIWASSATDIWTSAEGTLLHYNGTTWVSIWVSPADTMIGLGGFSATDVHSLGQNGSVAIYNGSTWALNYGNNGVGNQGWSAEFGVADTALCAVAVNGEYLCNTSSGASTEGSVTGVHFLSLWGPAALTLYAGTSTGAIYKATNTGGTWTWVTQTSPTADSIEGLYGTGATAIWGCGQAGTIVMNTGTATWTLQTSNTTQSLKALWANPNPPTGYTADVYAVGDGGVIQHYNGTAWTPMVSGVTTPLRTVWGLATTNVYAAGDDGVILLGVQ